MTVAVVVATRDRPDRLARCLDAILSGTTRPDELVVVDQGVDDPAKRIVDARPPARHVRQGASGLSASRNAGIASTSADVIAFTDDDCVPDPRWLESLVEPLRAGSAAASTGRVLPLDDDAESLYAISSRTGDERRTFTGRVAPWVTGTGANTAVRRASLELVGPFAFDERLGAGSPGRAGEDVDLLDRLLRSGGSVVFEPAAVVRHERQTLERRLETRGGYGHGVGAFCALALRRGDPYALAHLGRWLGLRTRLLAGALVRGRTMGVREELLVLRGTGRGLVYGARVSGRQT